MQRYLWSLAQEPARDVWQERLERLRIHDSEHASRLFETVERYLESNANRKEAAARLYVHRNTLRQRFDRIRRVAQIDLDDPAILFDLQVALRIVRYRDAAGRVLSAPHPTTAGRALVQLGALRPDGLGGGAQVGQLRRRQL